MLEHSAGAAGATGAAEVVSRTAARSPPPTRAWGQDDGSYTQSLKLNYIFHLGLQGKCLYKLQKSL